jgi:hypothetical protein
MLDWLLPGLALGMRFEAKPEEWVRKNDWKNSIT